MCTTRSLPYEGISLTETPLDRECPPPRQRSTLDWDPQTEIYLGQRPPWTESAPSPTEIHPGLRPPDRDPPWTETPLDRDLRSPWTEWQICVKTLPCTKLRLRVVISSNSFWSVLSMKNDSNTQYMVSRTQYILLGQWPMEDFQL